MNKLRMQSIPSNASTVYSDEKLVSKALDLMDRGQHKQALTILDGVIAKKPRHYLAALNRGVCLSKVGRLKEAAKQFYSVHQIVPEDLNVLQLCGESHLAAGHLNLAIEFFKRCVKRNPAEVSNWTNLSIAAGESGHLTEAVMYATQALSLAPLEASSYINLGTTLLSLNRLNEAEQAYETALAIDPNNVIAAGNLATVLDKRGDYLKAIECYDSTYLRMDANSQDAKVLLYRSSFPYLGAGKLREGWKRYEFGFCSNDIASRHPKRHFNVPQWNGESLERQQRLLIWGEQGLGDELTFFGLLKEVQSLCNDVTIECDSRLVSLLQRSFPNWVIRPTNLKKEISPVECDFHIPAGSLMGIFRNEISDFQKFKPYLKPNINLEQEFAHRMKSQAGKKLVGICWRSGKIDARRIENYLPLEDFADILTDPKIVVVNLQYGDCEQELRAVEKAFDIEILRWKDIDLKNDQEALAALINNLDAVISAGTAVAPMALAVGAPLLWFGLRGWTWFGQEEYPWAGNMKYIAPENNQQLRSALPKIGQALQNLLNNSENHGR